MNLINHIKLPIMLARFLFLQAVLASIAVTADSNNQDVLSNAPAHITASGIGGDVFDNREHP